MSFEKILSRRKHVRTIEMAINKKTLEDLIAVHLQSICVLRDSEDADIILTGIPGPGVPFQVKIKKGSGSKSYGRT